jgi:hypothetical protein
MSDEERSPEPGDLSERLKERIVNEQERLGPDDTFQFSCHPGISCFNNCCADVNIFLSPYDVLRLKKRLGMTTTEFLQKHALLPVQKDMPTPVVLLRMEDNEDKTCPFLTPEGCGVYSDRPWPCRMYPLGLASSKDTEDGWQGERFYFLLEEEGCRGFCESGGKEWTVREWMDDQGVDEYDRWGEAYKELALHESFQEGNTLPPEKMEMFFTATYDLDKFRQFVFESTFLDRFEVDEDQIEEMRYSDEALLRFGVLWLRFALFGEKTMRVRPRVAEAFKGQVSKQALAEK